MPDGRFRRPEEVAEYIFDLIKDNQGKLGLGYIGFGEDDLIPQYPAVIIQAEPLTRAQHATQQFLITFTCVLFIYHADMNESHTVRTLSDMELATKIVDLLHSKYTLDGGILFGFVDSEIPGTIVADTGNQVIATRLTWTGETRTRYNEGG